MTAMPVVVAMRGGLRVPTTSPSFRLRLTLIFAAVGLLLASGVALADDELYKTKNCFACHRIDRTTLGPSFRHIAAKYVDDKAADVKLARKIRDGGVGVWGQTPMPPQPQVTEDEAATLARWILQLK